MVGLPRVAVRAVGRQRAGGPHARLVLIGDADDDSTRSAQSTERARFAGGEQVEGRAVARGAPRQRVHVLDKETTLSLTDSAVSPRSVMGSPCSRSDMGGC